MRRRLTYLLILLLTALAVLYLTAPGVDDRIYQSQRDSGEPQNDIPGPQTSEKYEVALLSPAVPMPWDLEFLPDGTMLITSKRGGVYHFDGQQTTQILNLTPFIAGHTGLMGMAIDPRFAASAWVYLYYTHEAGGNIEGVTTGDEEAVRSRIVRFRLQGQQLVFDKILLDDIPGSFQHAGGGLEFGPDDALYATTGDADHADKAADRSFLGGKILRMDREGKPLADSPISGSLVYTSGHRNPQGLAWQPGTGIAFDAEHGAFRHDEVNLLIPGVDYGWDKLSCDKRRVRGLRRVWFQLALWLPESFTRVASEMPVYCPETWNMAPSQMTFVNEADHPWFGDLFVGSLVGQHVRRFVVSSTGEVQHSEIFFQGADDSGPTRIRDVEFYAGDLYLLGDGAGLARLRPVASAD